MTENRKNYCCGYPDDWSYYDNDEFYEEENCDYHENNYQSKNNNGWNDGWYCKCDCHCYKKREEKKCNRKHDNGGSNNIGCLCGLFRIFGR